MLLSNDAIHEQPQRRIDRGGSEAAEPLVDRERCKTMHQRPARKCSSFSRPWCYFRCAVR